MPMMYANIYIYGDLNLDISCTVKYNNIKSTVIYTLLLHIHTHIGQTPCYTDVGPATYMLV